MKSVGVIQSLVCGECGSSLAPDLPAGFCSRCCLLGALALPDPRPAEDTPRHLDPPSTRSAFGDYELIAEIARGGMGAVWKARQTRLNREVAIKLILNGRFARKEEIARFHAEAESAARLRHPHIVTVFESGEIEGQHYLTMEYVAGTTLAELVRPGTPLDPKRAAAYLEAVAHAVQHAHDRGILHRDLKPSNVLLDNEDQPRVTDFGLAKRLDGSPGPTATGQILGSPSYSAPEQLSGSTQLLGPPCDVYGLGATLYHLITGRPPFAAARLADTLQQVQTAEPVAPRALDPGLPRDLETICLKCLEKDPHRRYASAREVAEELGRFRRDEPILARPVGLPGRMLRWVRRNPLGAALVVVLTLAVATTSTLLHRLWRERERNQDKMQVIRENLMNSLEELWNRPERKAETVSSEALAAMMNSVRPRPPAGAPLRLTVGVSVTESPLAQMQRYEPMLSRLEQRLDDTLGRPVLLDLRLSKFNTLDLDSMQDGRLALKRFGALSYIRLHERFPGFRAIVREEPPKDSVIFVRKGSGIRQLSDLAGHSFAFGEPHSTISCWAKVQLVRAGITGAQLSRWEHLESHQAYVDRMRRTGFRAAMSTAVHNHAEVIQAVRQGRFDAGVARRTYVQDFLRDELEFLATFDSPSNAWVAGEGLEAPVVAALQEALCHPEVYRPSLASVASGPVRFVYTDDTFFDPLRAALTNEIPRFEGTQRVQSRFLEDDE